MACRRGMIAHKCKSQFVQYDIDPLMEVNATTYIHLNILTKYNLLTQPKKKELYHLITISAVT